MHPSRALQQARVADPCVGRHGRPHAHTHVRFLLDGDEDEARVQAGLGSVFEDGGAQGGVFGVGVGADALPAAGAGGAGDVDVPSGLVWGRMEGGR